MAVIAAALAVLASVLTLTVSRDSSEPTDRRPSSPGNHTSGPLTLKSRPGWSGSTQGLPGFRFSGPIVLEERVSGLRLVAGVLPATSSTLLPEELIRRLRAPAGRPATVRFDNGLRGYYFRGLDAAGIDGPLDVYVLPTTAGIATTACAGIRDLVTPDYDCWNLVKGITLRRARGLPLGPDSAFRQRLPGVIAELDAARLRAREPLASRVPAQQASSASQLAAAYDTAVTTMTPLLPRSPARPRAIVREMAGAGRAYAAVAGALQEADATEFARGRDAVQAHEARLKRLLLDPRIG